MPVRVTVSPALKALPSPIDSPFAARYYTKVPGRLDADRMQQAAQYFVGKHDFLALCASGSSAAAHGDTVRTITACDVQRRGDDIDITVTADGYLYNMVRILAGTLCEAGAGRLAPEAVPGIRQPRPQKRWADAGGERAFPQERGLRHAHRITQTRPMLPEGKTPLWEHCHCTKGQESMRKRQRGPRPVSDEPLSAGRVEYPEQARERVRNRRIRRTALIVVALTLVVLFTTGIVGSSVAMAKDWADTARILLFPGTGWPQQTGVMEVKQLAAMNSSFVELGEEGCVVWSRTGTRLNSIQSGYARPALAVGKNRFVLYNRFGQ